MSEYTEPIFLDKFGDLLHKIKSEPDTKLSELARIAGLDLAKDYIEADLSGDDLSSDVLPNLNLSHGNLSKTILTGTNLSCGTFIDTDLTGANLTKATLTKATLTGANLTEANLTEANLTEANLTGANLTGADLTGADLTGADLTGADLTGADLTGAAMKDAKPTPSMAYTKNSIPHLVAMASKLGAPEELLNLFKKIISPKTKWATHNEGVLDVIKKKQVEQPRLTELSELLNLLIKEINKREILQKNPMEAALINLQTIIDLEIASIHHLPQTPQDIIKESKPSETPGIKASSKIINKSEKQTSPNGYEKDIDEDVKNRLREYPSVA